MKNKMYYKAKENKIFSSDNTLQSKEGTKTTPRGALECKEF